MLVPAPLIMYKTMKDIKRKWENTYVRLDFGPYYFMGELYISPSSSGDESNKEIKEFIEKRFNLKLKPDLNKGAQTVDYMYYSPLMRIIIRDVLSCTLLSEETTVEESTKTVCNVVVKEEVEEVEMEVTEEVTVRTYRCPGGVEYTVESRKEV